jgi:hypothetical protein
MMQEVEERIKERIVLLSRIFNEYSPAIIKIGREIGDSYCMQFNDQGYDPQYRSIDRKQALYDVASKITEQQLLELYLKHKDEATYPRSFFGRFYTFDDKSRTLKCETIWPEIKQKLESLYKKHEKAVRIVLEACYLTNKRGEQWDNYLKIQYYAKDHDAKGWKHALTDLESAGIVWRHKGDVILPEELMPLIEEMLAEWAKRPEKKPVAKVKVDKHEILSQLVSAYPNSVFDEKWILAGRNVPIGDDKIDLVFVNKQGKYLIVDVKTAYNEGVIGQLLRYKTGYAKSKGISENDISLAVVCLGEVNSKYLKPATDAGIKIFTVRIESHRLI